MSHTHTHTHTHTHLNSNVKTGSADVKYLQGIICMEAMLSPAQLQYLFLQTTTALIASAKTVHACSSVPCVVATNWMQTMEEDLTN